MDVPVFIKLTSPPGPGRGVITLTPGDFTSSGSWSAIEDQHDGARLFSVMSGTYSIKDRVVTLLGPDLKTTVRLVDWAKNSTSGPAQILDPTEGTSVNIAWKYGAAWPIDY